MGIGKGGNCDPRDVHPSQESASMASSKLNLISKEMQRPFVPYNTSQSQQNIRKQLNSFFASNEILCAQKAQRWEQTKLRPQTLKLLRQGQTPKIIWFHHQNQLDPSSNQATPTQYHAHPLVALVGEVPHAVDGDVDTARDILHYLLELLGPALLRGQLASSVGLIVFAGEKKNKKITSCPLSLSL